MKKQLYFAEIASILLSFRVGVSLFASPATPFIPGGLDSVGLTRLVPDSQLFTNNTVANLDNWEPYTSLVGNSTFLIEANTFAEGSTANQRFALVFQPVDGGSNKVGDVFYADNRTPFRGQINLSRQDGNPGRVAGDLRPGATNFITGAESSPFAFPEFQSDNRWKLGFDYTSLGLDENGERFAAVQTYSLEPATLTQNMISEAIDSANGRLTSGAPDGNQVTRFGGELIGLDNGNFVSLVEDRSKIRNPDGDAGVATIFSPSGSVVKDSFVVDNGDIWSNLAADKGGFAVRMNGTFQFFDNAGVLKGTSPQSDSGASFDAGRGDGTRIAGHINSPYIFLAGADTVDGIVKIAAWDSRNHSFVAATNVSELNLEAKYDRAYPTVDALNRVAVSFTATPTGFEAAQTLVRVLAFDDTSKTFKYLTPSFFPFLNWSTNNGISVVESSVAMTTRQILVAAKGSLNSTNNPSGGADTFAQTTLYTVFAHPDPRSDPTTGIDGGTVGQGQPSELGMTVNGFQDDFTSATRDPNWVPIGPGGDHYTQGDGVLKVSVSSGDPNHLLYMGPGASNSVQEVLARVRVVNFGTGDPSRAGIGVGVSTNKATLSQGLNLHFRDNTQDSVPGRQFKFLDDARSWGPAGLRTNVPGQLSPGWTNNVWYWMRLRLDPKADGTNDLYGKVWLADGSVAEPSNWLMTWSSSASTPKLPAPIRSGFAGITGSSIGGLGQFEVDYILIKSAGLPQIKVAFDATGPSSNNPILYIPVANAAKTTLSLDWFGGGELQASSQITGPWSSLTNLPPASLPISGTTAGRQKFFRLQY